MIWSCVSSSFKVHIFKRSETVDTGDFNFCCFGSCCIPGFCGFSAYSELAGSIKSISLKSDCVDFWIILWISLVLIDFDCTFAVDLLGFLLHVVSFGSISPCFVCCWKKVERSKMAEVKKLAVKIHSICLGPRASLVMRLCLPILLWDQSRRLRAKLSSPHSRREQSRCSIFRFIFLEVSHSMHIIDRLVNAFSPRMDIALNLRALQLRDTVPAHLKVGSNWLLWNHDVTEELLNGRGRCRQLRIWEMHPKSVGLIDRHLLNGV